MTLREGLAAAVLLAAAALVSYGTWLIYRPAGFIIGGLCLAGCGWLVLSD